MILKDLLENSESHISFHILAYNFYPIIYGNAKTILEAYDDADITICSIYTVTDNIIVDIVE